MAEGEGFEPPVPFPVQRFSSSTVGSEPFGKFSTILLFSTGYKSVDLLRSAWKRFVLIVQPLQFHYSAGTTARDLLNHHSHIQPELGALHDVPWRTHRKNTLIAADRTFSRIVAASKPGCKVVGGNAAWTD